MKKNKRFGAQEEKDLVLCKEKKSVRAKESYATSEEKHLLWWKENIWCALGRRLGAGKYRTLIISRRVDD